MASFGKVKKESATIPDFNKMVKMSTSALEGCKKQMLRKGSAQAKNVAAKNDIKIDEIIPPDFEWKAPVKDVKRLATLPLQPPTFIQLTDGQKKSYSGTTL